MAPIAVVAAVVFSDDSILIIRRGTSRPAAVRAFRGVVELGETIEEAIVLDVGGLASRSTP